MPANPNILLIASPLEEEHVARLRALAPEHLQVLHDPALLPTPRFPGDHAGTPIVRTPQQQARWQAMLSRANILFGLPEPADLPFLSRLAWVQTTGTGLGHTVARPGPTQLGLDRLGVLVTTARGVHAGPLAEWAFMAILAHTRGLDRLKADQAAHRWEPYSGEDLAGRTLVTIGAGDLACAIARVARAFALRTVALTRDPARPRPDATLFDALMPAAELHLALAMADILVMAAPTPTAARPLMDATAFAALKPGALFVNIASGPAVDHDALLESLRTGQVAYAALDVTDPEPLPSGHPLWDHPNTLVSPHSASRVRRENARITQIFAHNLACWIESRRPDMRNVLDTRQAD